MDSKFSAYQRLSKNEKTKIFLRFSNSQNFSIPRAIAFYITKNPTAKAYQKLIKTCKHFFIKNPVIVTEFLNCEDNNVCNFKNLFSRQRNFKDIPYKIWITDELSNTYNPNRTCISLLIPRIYRSEIKILELYLQILSYDHMKFLAASVEKCQFRGVTVKYNNGTETPFENIIELFPRLFELKCDYDEPFMLRMYNEEGTHISKDTVSNLIKIPRFQHLKLFHIMCAPVTFDFQTLYTFHKAKKWQCKVFVVSYEQLLQDVVTQYNSIVDDILLNSSEMPPIVVSFIGISEQKGIDLFRLYDKRCETVENQAL